MRVYDPQGEYTEAEIKDVLHGIDNSRKITYRYERLDKNNKLIEEIDYVEKCSIENNFLADIKRTAKFDMYDTGSFNFLSDRIKPYIRVEMPGEQTYFDRVRSLSPAVWFRLDEPSRGTRTAETLDDAGDKASVSTPVSNLTPTHTRTSTLTFDRQGTGVRQYHSTIIDNRDTQAIRFELESLTTLPSVNSPNTVFRWHIFEQSTSTTPSSVPATGVLAQGYLPIIAGTKASFTIENPVAGTYYVLRQELEHSPSSRPQVRVKSHMSRIHPMTDSSENRVPSRTSLIPDSGAGLINNASGITTNRGESGNLMPGFNMSLMTGSKGPFGTHTLRTLNHVISRSTASIDAVAGIYYVEFVARNITASTPPVVGLEVTGPLDPFGKPTFVTLVQTHSTTRVGDAEATGAFSKYRAVISVPTQPANSTMKIHMNVTGEWDFWTDAMRLVRTAAAVGGTEGQNGRSIAVTPTAPFGWEAYNSDIPLKESISLNYWQKLGTSGAGFSSKSTYSFSDGYIEIAATKAAGANAVFTVKVVSGGTYGQSSNYTSTLNVRSAAFTDKIQMVSVLVNPQRGRTSLYLDGSFMGRFTETGATALGDVSGVFSDARLSGMRVDFSSPAGTYHVDDYAVFSPAMPEWSVHDVSDAAKESKAPRRGYVEWSQGVFLLSAPSRNMAETGSVMRNVAAYDQLLALKEDSYVDRYAVTPGILYTEAIAEVLRSTLGASDDLRGLYSNPAQIPSVLEWEPGTPKLTIVNDLLNAINYDTATFDEDGYFVGKPYVSPSMRPSEYTYATDSTSIITGQVDQTIDLFAVPNSWTLIVSVPEEPPMVANYVNDNPNSVTSTVSRGRTIVDVRTENNVATQADLNARVLRLATEASQIYEHITWESGLMPIHQNSDVYNLVIDGLVINDKYSETSWSMDLENGATMKHSVRRAVEL